MKFDEKEFITRILAEYDHLPYIRPEDIPSIDLYMDQVTTFMDEHLKSACRYPGDKILTKTMINNYAKNKLLPPPEKKKYSDEHIVVLILIYYFKGVMSRQDIQSILDPLTERFFRNSGSFDLKNIYREIFSSSTPHAEDIRKRVQSLYEAALSSFPDADETDRDFLRFFTLITWLSLDIYIKKKIIEKLIDDFSEASDSEGNTKTDKSGRKKKSRSSPESDTSKDS